MNGMELKRLIKGYFKMKQGDFAELLSVPQPSLSEWVNGKRDIPPYIIRLIRALVVLHKFGMIDTINSDAVLDSVLK